MILHRIEDGFRWIGDNVPAYVAWIIAFGFGWAAGLGLLWLRISGTVVNAGQVDNSNGMGNFVEVVGIIISSVMLIGTLIATYIVEGKIIEKRQRRAKEALDRRVDARLAAKREEAELGFDPWPWDDEIEEIVKREAEAERMNAHHYAHVRVDRVDLVRQWCEKQSKPMLKDLS